MTSMDAETVALTDAQERALRTMAGVGRSVGSRSTQPDVGYVHTATAKTLVELGLARHEHGAKIDGRAHDVFIITDVGRALLSVDA